MNSQTNIIESKATVDCNSLGSLLDYSTELWDIHQTMKAGPERRKIAIEYNEVAKKVNAQSKNGKILRLIH
jgi:hypothetical protein